METQDNWQLNFDEFTQQFVQYHLDNPHIYQEFKKFTFKAMAKGFKHYGAKAIFEIIRFETGVKGNDQFKVNNNYTPYFARLFEKDHPEHKDFFYKRKSKFDEPKEEYKCEAIENMKEDLSLLDLET